MIAIKDLAKAPGFGDVIVIAQVIKREQNLQITASRVLVVGFGVTSAAQR